MSINLTAVQVPSPPLLSAYLSLAANLSGAGNAPAAQVFATGDTLSVPGKLNANALEADLSYRWGGGGVGIGVGLTVTASGLIATVQPGIAAIDGLSELALATTANLTDNATNYLYLLQTKVLQVVTGSLVVPAAGKACYLGALVVTTGTSAPVDTSGVCYKRGGRVWRQTADAGMPADALTMPAGVAVDTRTLYGLFSWDGTAYEPIDLLNLTGWQPGVMVNNALLYRFVATRPVTLPAALVGSRLSAAVAATAITVLTVNKNGVSAGTATFAAAGTVATLAAAAAIVLAAGDVLSLTGPATADTTLAGVAWNLEGYF